MVHGEGIKRIPDDVLKRGKRRKNKEDENMMTQVSVNWASVLVATIASMVVGMTWYSKSVFGGMWMQLSGRTEKDMQKAKQKGMGKTMVAAFIAALVTSYVLAYFLHMINAMTWVDGIQAGFWLWLGFVAPLMLGMVLWEGKPFKLYVLNAAHHLVSLMVMGAILARWM